MTQGAPFQGGTCHTCGAALTPDDFRVPACRYCGSAHAHHQRAAEKVAVVQAVMAGMSANGLPGALQGNPYGGSPGLYGPGPYAPSPPGVYPTPGAYPMGQAPPFMQQQLAAKQRAQVLVFVVIGAGFALALAGAVIAVLMR